MPKITILRANDWNGLFIDGKLFYQNHSIREQDVLKALEVDYEIKEIDNYEPLEYEGMFPDTLEKCKQKGIIN